MQTVGEPSQANYVLFGIAGDNNLQVYGFSKLEIAARDSLEVRPVMTDWFELMPGEERDAIDSLKDRVLKLSKIRGG